ncbi:MAG TPA: molybdopterin molybdotransferase MoeA [Myxococcota bacterium]|nr:molybdopterin molybdotransferase MoeA [Myxococcota bacterium]
MISYEAALELIRSEHLGLSARAISCTSALNRVLATDIVAPIDLPPFDNSAVDGFAVKAATAQVGKCLPVMGSLRAATQTRTVLPEGFSAKIMTGAPIPMGADAVVMKEHVAEAADGITVNIAVAPNDNIRFHGEDIKKGHLVCPAGSLVSPHLMGALCGLGIDRVLVYEPPKIRIVSTGDELVCAPTSLSFGQVYYLVGPMLAAQCQQLGIKDVEFCLVKDDQRAVGAAIEMASDADIVLVTGGMSKGDYDFAYLALKQSEVGEIFYQGAWRPGKPLFFGERQGSYFFGLPGNPVAAFICFHVFVRPLIFQAMNAMSQCATLQAKLGEDFTKKPGITVFAGAILNEENQLVVQKNQGSHQIFNLSLAKALAVLPDGKGLVKASELIHYFPL